MNLDEYIGVKIRELRNQYGLTQEELADRTELTKGFISQLERGLTAASVATLNDIVTCLGSNLSDFFREEVRPQLVFGEEDYSTKIDRDGNVTTWLVPTSQVRSLEPIIVTIQPHQALAMDKPHEGEEFGYVLSGEIVLHHGDSAFPVKTGESFSYQTDRDHWLSCENDDEAKVLWISCPPNF